MNRYISYGGGVNSTAMAILLLTDPRFAEARKNGVRIIMSDTGNEYPETYAYVKDVFGPWLRALGHRGIEWVKSDLGTLEEYCLARKIVPSRQKPWCSDKFKIRPIHNYLKAQGMLPTVQYLGIHYGEISRVSTSGLDDVLNEFPLVDLKIDQDGCLAIIEAAGLPLPIKSGCFFCPNSRKQGIIDLERNHPDLFARLAAMEKNGSGFAKGFRLFSKKFAVADWIINGRIRKDKPAASGCASQCFKGNMGAALARDGKEKI